MGEQKTREREEIPLKEKDIGNKKKWSVWKSVLWLLALPIIVPTALIALGCAVTVALVTFGGGLIIFLAAAGGVIAAVMMLAAIIACAVIGLGFGTVILSSAPASGMAVIGLGLMVLGASLLGGMLLTGCLSLLKRLFDACSRGVLRIFCRKKEKEVCYEA